MPWVRGRLPAADPGDRRANDCSGDLAGSGQSEGRANWSRITSSGEPTFLAPEVGRHAAWNGLSSGGVQPRRRLLSNLRGSGRRTLVPSDPNLRRVSYARLLLRCGPALGVDSGGNMASGAAAPRAEPRVGICRLVRTSSGSFHCVLGARRCRRVAAGCSLAGVAASEHVVPLRACPLPHRRARDQIPAGLVTGRSSALPSGTCVERLGVLVTVQSGRREDSRVLPRLHSSGALAVFGSSPLSAPPRASRSPGARPPCGSGVRDSHRNSRNTRCSCSHRRPGSGCWRIAGTGRGWLARDGAARCLGSTDDAGLLPPLSSGDPHPIDLRPVREPIPATSGVARGDHSAHAGSDFGSAHGNEARSRALGLALRVADRSSRWPTARRLGGQEAGRRGEKRRLPACHDFE
jgi:hypothetical protein